MRLQLFLAMLSGSLLASQGSYMNLSNGVVFPSANSALFENPAGLGAFPARAVELGIFSDEPLSTPESGTASVVRSSSQTTGIGLGCWKQTSESPYSARAGIGFGTSQTIATGLAASYVFSSKELSLDLGIRIGAEDRPTIGIVLQDIRPIPSRWTLGIAWEISGRVIPEIDVTVVNRNSSFEPSFVSALGGFSIVARGLLAVRVGYPISIYPDLHYKGYPIELGVALNLGQKAAVFAVLNDHRGPPFFLGFKFNL